MEDILLSEDERAMKVEARRFVRDVPHDLIRDLEAEKVAFPRSFLDLAAGAGLVGLRFPARYGGREASWVGDMAAVEEMGRLGFTLSCMYSLGTIVGEAIHRFGTPAQKETYLRGITSGKRYGAEAITEPSGGSDLFGMMRTTALRHGGGFVLNGQKRFIVGGQGADFFVVYALTDPAARPRTKGVSAFLVDRDAPGLRVETMYGLMGNKGGGTARIAFKDLAVPEDHLVGEENRGYDVFTRMMVPERLTTASGSLGVAAAAIEVAANYALRRESFGAKLMEHEGVSFRVAESLTAIAHATALVYTASRAADALEAGKASPAYVRKLVSMAKLNSTEVMWEAVNNAMQVLGGIGYTTVYPVERLLRDSRLGMIWTGTSEVMKLIIQHEYVKEISQPDFAKDKRNLELDAPGFDLVEEKVFS